MQKNIDFIESIKDGQRWALVYPQPTWDDQVQVSGNGDLYFAVAILGNGSVMPYPLLEEAMDKVFKQSELLEDENSVIATITEFENWLGKNFPGYCGSVEADPQDKAGAYAVARGLALKHRVASIRESVPCRGRERAAALGSEALRRD